MYMRGSRKRDRYVYGTMNFPVQLCSIVFESEEGEGGGADIEHELIRKSSKILSN